MLFALSGTPGTGKSTVTPFLERNGYVVIDLDEFAAQVGAIRGKDPRTKSREVDVEVLRSAKGTLPDGALLRSHYAHLLGTDVAIILRCHPRVLELRLRKRGWAARKVKENVQAETLDVITVEAFENSRIVYEVETTQDPPEVTARNLLQILRGNGKRFLAGKIDYSEEVLAWY